MARAYTLPSCQSTLEICIYYNRKNGCTNTVKCKRLHLCQYFITSQCKHGSDCKRSHNVLGEQPKLLLKKNGIKVNRRPKEVFDELRALFHHKRSSSSESSDDEEEECDVSELKLHKPRELEEAACMDVSKICMYNLRGKCFTRRNAEIITRRISCRTVGNTKLRVASGKKRRIFRRNGKWR